MEGVSRECFRHILDFLDTSVSHLRPLSLARAWQGRIVCVDLRPNRGVDYMLSSGLLQSSDLGFGLGNREKVIPLYFSRHRSFERHWPNSSDEPLALFSAISDDVPALLTLCCCLACDAVFPSLRAPRACLRAPRACLSAPRACLRAPRTCLCAPRTCLRAPRAVLIFCSANQTQLTGYSD